MKLQRPIPASHLEYLRARNAVQPAHQVDISAATVAGICVATGMVVLVVGAVVSLVCKRRPFPNLLGAAVYKTHLYGNAPTPTSSVPSGRSSRKASAVVAPRESPSGLPTRTITRPVDPSWLPRSTKTSPTETGADKTPRLSPNVSIHGSKQSSPSQEKPPTPICGDKAIIQAAQTLEQQQPLEERDPNNLGKLNFRVSYCQKKQILQVSVVKCLDLPPNTETSSTPPPPDPYVKLQLLPDKQHKVKTRVVRNNYNPVYNEDFSFYGISANQLASMTLHFIVLRFDRYSRDDVIGEILYKLPANVPEDPVSVEEDIKHRQIKLRTTNHGELLVSVCYQPAAKRLTVVVLKARNLPRMDVGDAYEPFVKIYLIFNGQRIAKKKTRVKKKNINPVFNESFVFDVPYEEALSKLSLEFVVLDWDRVTKNEILGKLELGPKAESATARKHWAEVEASPRRQIAEWHQLN